MKKRIDDQTQLQKYLLKFAPLASLKFYNPHSPRDHCVVLRKCGFLATDWPAVAIRQSSCPLFPTPASGRAGSAIGVPWGTEDEQSAGAASSPTPVTDGHGPTSALEPAKDPGASSGPVLPQPADAHAGGACGHGHPRFLGFPSGPDAGV